MCQSKFSLLLSILLLTITLNSCKEKHIDDEALVFPVEYLAPYQMTFGQELKVDFSSFKDVKKVEILIDDSLLKSWNGPFQQASYSFDIQNLGIGKKELQIKATDTNGKIDTDNQVITILSDIHPEEFTAKIIQKYQHDASHFTQGLEIVDGIMYEGTGDPNHGGQTKVMKKSLKTGEILKEQDLPSNYFGEGITILNDKLYQVTWTSQICFTYDFPSMEKRNETLSYTGEGWGLTNNGNQIIMSDGSERIYFRDPKTFQIKRIIQAYDNVGVVKNLNELEYFDGLIYANIWMTDKIVAIEPTTGKVLKTIDCADLAKEIRGNGDVLNGIAYDHDTKKIYLTGKYFPYLVEALFEKR